MTKKELIENNNKIAAGLDDIQSLVSSLFNEIKRLQHDVDNMPFEVEDITDEDKEG